MVKSIWRSWLTAGVVAVSVALTGCAANSEEAYFGTPEIPTTEPLMLYNEAIHGSEHTLWNVRHALSKEFPDFTWRPDKIVKDDGQSQAGGACNLTDDNDYLGNTGSTFGYSFRGPTDEWDWDRIWAVIEQELTTAGFGDFYVVRNGEQGLYPS